jgi:hypothetical protein
MTSVQAISLSHIIPTGLCATFCVWILYSTYMKRKRTEILILDDKTTVPGGYLCRHFCMFVRKSTTGHHNKNLSSGWKPRRSNRPLSCCLDKSWAPSPHSPSHNPSANALATWKASNVKKNIFVHRLVKRNGHFCPHTERIFMYMCI